MIGVHSRAAAMKSLLRLGIFIKSSWPLDSRARRKVGDWPQLFTFSSSIKGMAKECFSRRRRKSRFSHSAPLPRLALDSPQQFVKGLLFHAAWAAPFLSDLRSICASLRLNFRLVRKVHVLNVAQCQLQVVPQYRRLLVIQLSIHHRLRTFGNRSMDRVCISQVRQINLLRTRGFQHFMHMAIFLPTHPRCPARPASGSRMPASRRLVRPLHRGPHLVKDLLVHLIKRQRLLLQSRIMLQTLFIFGKTLAQLLQQLPCPGRRPRPPLRFLVLPQSPLIPLLHYVQMVLVGVRFVPQSTLFLGKTSYVLSLSEPKIVPHTAIQWLVAFHELSSRDSSDFPMPHFPMLLCPDFPILPCSPCLSASVVGFAFPITRDVGDHGDSGDGRASRATALCLRPSARHPPGIHVLLKTKAQPQFERPVERLSTPLFRVFSAPNHVISALCLPVAFNWY